MSNLCDEDNLRTLISAMKSDPASQLGRIDELLQRFPDDARLHLMLGSVLVGQGRLIEAHRSLSEAVAIAPDFAIARFQLGFFQLTSGEAANALDTWGRLDQLPDGHYLRAFVDGLRCLIRDDFAGVIGHLREGIGLNDENPPLNQDMQLIIDRCTPLLNASGEESEASSETSFILRQFSGREQKH